MAQTQLPHFALEHARVHCMEVVAVIAVIMAAAGVQAHL